MESLFTHNIHLQAHLDNIYAEKLQGFAFQAKSKAAFDHWKSQTHSKIRQLLGIEERSLPPNIAVTSLAVMDRGDYIEERLLLEVSEDVKAPIFVLLPKTPPPYAPILTFHGHGSSVQHILDNYSDDVTAQNQLSQDVNYAQKLVRAGYLVCVIEQRGFGERITNQYNTAKGNACRHLSFEYMLHGRTLMGERCWDGMVTLSYLQTRKDCLPGMVGCTGHSGGGTTALWLAALDNRINICVPSCCFSSFKDSILGIDHCECNYVPGILEICEMGELAALIAPRPLCLINGLKDTIFPVKGALQQFEVVRQAYEILDASDKCMLAVHPEGHTYSHSISQEWFLRWFGNF